MDLTSMHVKKYSVVISSYNEEWYNSITANGEDQGLKKYRIRVSESLDSEAYEWREIDYKAIDNKEEVIKIFSDLLDLYELPKLR